MHPDTFNNYLLRQLSTLIFLLIVATPIVAQNSNFPTDEMVNFDKVANYLTRGSGKWKAPNPRYDAGNPRSAEAFGLWFERPMRNFMSLTIVSYQKDTVLINSTGFFSWHPGKNQFIHVNGNRGSGFSEGITEFPSDSSFISKMTIYNRRGSYEHKDENFLVSENVHRNTSFRKDENGSWVAEGEWTWTREAEEE